MPKGKLEFAPDVIKLLTGLLYPEPKMAIREILANAADALSMADKFFAPGQTKQILIRPDRTNSTLVIEDNGIGMDLQEADVLNKVGADLDKRQRFEDLLKEKNLSTQDIKEQLSRLIGRYAIGRLACLCIAEKVVIESRSRRQGKREAIQWSMEEGSTETQISTSKRQEPGTRVTLFIKEAYRDQILEEKNLEAIIKEYGIFLPYQIYINTELSDPVNILEPVIYEAGQSRPDPVLYRHPSERRQQAATDPKARYQDLWDTIYSDLSVDPPITILPLSTPRTCGLLFIPSSPSFPYMGRVRLWCRRIFVKSNEEDLLPAWSRDFLSGIIDCKADPNLSRTDLLRSDEKEYLELKAEIENEIVRLMGILSGFSEQWQNILVLYRSAIVYAANLNEELLKRIGDTIPFRKAISLKGQAPESFVTLEDYKRSMNRRRGDASEVPLGAKVSQDDQQQMKQHLTTLYYYTGEGSLAGIIEKETVLHAPSDQDVNFLHRWCDLNNFSYMDVGRELPFEDAPQHFDSFIDIVRDAIGTDAEKRNLEIRTVKMSHRRDIPCMLTSENPSQMRQEKYVRQLNKMSDEEFDEIKRQLKDGPFKIESLSRSRITEMLAQARVLAEEEKTRDAFRKKGLKEVLYLNMDNELMLYLARNDNFEADKEKKLRSAAIHELWHGVKIARGEPITHPNSEHHFQTATDFLTRVLLDVYEPWKKARKELNEYKQMKLDQKEEA
ncbi:MAG: ATP-binding protein [bacterium]